VSENNRSLPDDLGDALREVGRGMLCRRRCTLSVRERSARVKGESRTRGQTKGHLECTKVALFALPRVSDESVIDQSPSYS
jgi:hypothetical protein